jgi:integrase
VGYGEKVPSPKGAYWRGRYKIAAGKYGTVRNADGDVIRYDTRRDAENAANDAEADVRAGRHRDRTRGQVTFGEWANRWYRKLDLAPSTMANYRQHIEYHLLPEFGSASLSSITADDVDEWESKEKIRHRPSSVRTWRGTLHTILQDAVPEQIPVNPVTRKRGRGRRTGKSRNRKKVITYPLEGLLIAERMSILSGRDDEFVMCVLMQWAGLRLGETIGLERECVHPEALRVEWQLYELPAEQLKNLEDRPASGTLLRCAPKDGSCREVGLPPFLRGLLASQIRQPGSACPCHGSIYVFRGLGRPRGASVPGATLRDVARIARVSPATVSYVLRGDGRVGAATRARVEEIIAKTRFIPQRAPDDTAWHWRRGRFEELFTAAASGWFPARSPLPRRPVPLEGEWPGIRVRGRNAQGRASLSWDPVAGGLTPHGLRHSHKSWMHQERVHEVLSEERLGHELPGIVGTYTHSTPAMRRHLAEAMERAWGEALDARLALSPRSPVAVLDGLLQERQSKIISRDSPAARPRVVRGRR